MRTILIVLVLQVAPGSAPGSDKPGLDKPKTVDEALLAKHRIEPTLEGVSAYLRKFLPTPEWEKKAAQLIEKLGDDDFAVRESATRELFELPRVPIKQLRDAEESPDSEVARRASAILSHAKTVAKLDARWRHREVAAAVLRTIGEKPIPKSTPLILQLAGLLDARDLVVAAADAVAVTAEPADVPRLRRAIAGGNTQSRVIAIRGLGKAAGRSAKTEFVKLCRDLNPRVVLAAAGALAEQADRAALPVLIELARAKDEHVRTRSVQVLRALTKRNFALNPFQEVAKQKAQRQRWKAWLAKEGGTARLHVPLRLRPLPEDLTSGLLLHYTFDRDTDKRLHDASGQARHGTPRNAVQFTRRGRGKALGLGGQGIVGDRGGHAMLPSIGFASQKQFSIALWVRESGMTYAHGEAYITFGTDRGVGTEDALGIAHFNALLIFRAGSGQIALPYAAADRGRWVHYAMTFRDRRLRAYKGGTMIGTTAARVSVKSNRAALGRHWWEEGAGTSTRFQGAIDDVRIYDRALSSRQIRILQSATK